MRKSVNRAMFETAQLMIQQNAALSNPQAPAPVETPLTPEQRVAKARRDNIAGWQALHERYKREAAEGDARRFGKSSSS
jgi:hypothetical protein